MIALECKMVTGFIPRSTGKPAENRGNTKWKGVCQDTNPLKSRIIYLLAERAALAVSACVTAYVAAAVFAAVMFTVAGV